MADEKEEQKKPAGPRLAIKASDEAARGAYANLALVHQSDSEFVLDFIFAEPHRPQGQLVARVLASPRTTRRILAALGEAVRTFEQRNGEIKVEGGAPAAGNYH